MSVVALISLYDIENNAVRQLAAGLRLRGLRVLEIYFEDWRNNTLEWPTPLALERLAGVLRDNGACVAGISLRASAYERVCAKVCAFLRRAVGIPLIIGGWHATVRPERCLELADAVCVGEADGTLPTFVERLLDGGLEAAAGTPGFLVRLPSGQVTRASVPPLEVDLDALPWRDYRSPDKWVIRRGRVERGDPMARDPLCQIMCSIGCVQRCGFCHNSFDVGAAGPRLRVRSVDSVLREIGERLRANPAIRRIRFDDEIFGLRLDWLREFAARYPREIGLPFDFLTEPTVVGEEYAGLMAEAGATVAHLGIQSAPQVNQQTLARRGSLEQTRQAVERLHAAGLYIRYLVMIDIPGVTEQEREELFGFLASVPRPYDLYLFSLTYFPGARLVEDALAEGRIDEVDVEGVATKTFQQYRVDLSWPRLPEDAWWLAMMVLVASQTVRPGLLERMVRRRVGRGDPSFVIRAAKLATMAKIGRTAAGMVRSGELTPNLVQRWWNPQRLITM